MKKLGFIVSDTNMGNTELVIDPNFDDAPKGGLLMYGDKVTLFKTRQAARAAIERTNKFTTKHNFNWSTGYKIEVVVEQ